MRKKIVPLLLGLLNMMVVTALAVGFALLTARALRTMRVEPPVAVFLVPLYLAGARWIERRPAVELRLAGFPGDVGGGTLLGAALFTSVMGILWLAGAFHWSGWGVSPPVVPVLLSVLAGAATEELVFRGFLFRLVAAAGGNWTALAVTSSLFGLAHIGNRGATLTSSAAIALEAGILLGAAYAAAGTLWLPIGIHAGWNFAEGPLFGTAVSGHVQQASLLSGQLQGPVLLTGGAFGPEASIAAVGVCLAASAVFLRRMSQGISI